MRLLLRFGELRGRGIGRKRLLGFHFRRNFFLRRAGDSHRSSDFALRSDLRSADMPYRSRLGRDRGSFLDLLGEGELDAGKIERREDVRMRCIFEMGDQPRGDKAVD